MCQMGTELILRHATAQSLAVDFEANLRKGRAFVPGRSGLVERDLCTLCIAAPAGGEPLRLQAEAVWIDAGPEGGTGVSFVAFDARVRDELAAFVARAAEAVVAPAEPEPVLPDDAGDADASPPAAEDRADGPEPSSARFLHDRIRQLDLAARDGLARQGSLPERVALERRFGSSVWEGLLHNPQITPREVRHMAKSGSLPTNLVSLIVSNRAWLSDAAVAHALIENPRVSGVQLERVLRVLPQADLVRLSEQSSLRMQVRQAAKRLIRR
jgi:hypothetical protein